MVFYLNGSFLGITIQKEKKKKASDSPIIQISMLVLGLKWGFK